MGFEPTYKELKPKIAKQIFKPEKEQSFEPTYKELKQKIAKQIFKPEKEF